MTIVAFTLVFFLDLDNKYPRRALFAFGGEHNRGHFMPSRWHAAQMPDFAYADEDARLAARPARLSPSSERP
ncbi:hypothetical protein A6V36_10410 [Paraburkholderia ginsengiterrae]|uniref:Uncharacterized protein n=1 Tax=Paraburkholderia ginsengiterrae TaxID=1462993 RepID=A0A1A9NHN6_9BURK|nr:hypothetical protein [Paraburkholderia ginsengiterrae]OAJ53864.1 hypothetical protein A6V36_10410 [Paraburkholderia ginsengiterrae]OAJ65769.1 hypothetical protein A6V37_12430 [Paraburkholderia ginsengiterrae]